MAQETGRSKQRGGGIAGVPESKIIGAEEASRAGPESIVGETKSQS